jgi:tRNA G18 (ribose-2'-O)-methylase SpoU
VALTPGEGTVTLDEFSASSDGRRSDALLLLLGAEGSGLAAATLKRADVRVRIPVDPAFDSLNVVVAAGIALERLR